MSCHSSHPIVNGIINNYGSVVASSVVVMEQIEDTLNKLETSRRSPSVVGDMTLGFRVSPSAYARSNQNNHKNHTDEDFSN